MRVGLGIVTHERPEMFGRLAKSVCEHLDSSDIEVLAVHGYPGPGDGYGPATDELRRWARHQGIDWHLRASPWPTTVAQAKNQLLEMLGDCDWVILAEDDIEIIHDDVVWNYVIGAKMAGVGHLAFHGHGGLNPPTSGKSAGDLTAWPNSVGAWCLYSREALDAVGGFDECFHNAWEHVEHTLRLALAGYGGFYGSFLDLTGSETLLREQPGAVESSKIRNDPAWGEHIAKGKQHWAKAHPETYRLIWPGE